MDSFTSVTQVLQLDDLMVSYGFKLCRLKPQSAPQQCSGVSGRPNDKLAHVF